jgi:hypothetical protein
MKLKLFFLAMDLLTALAYPFLYIYGKFQSFLEWRKVSS